MATSHHEKGTHKLYYILAEVPTVAWGKSVEYSNNEICAVDNKSQQPQHTIFTKHITRSIPGETQAVLKHKPRSRPEGQLSGFSWGQFFFIQT